MGLVCKVSSSTTAIGDGTDLALLLCAPSRSRPALPVPPASSRRVMVDVEQLKFDARVQRVVVVAAHAGSDVLPLLPSHLDAVDRALLPAMDTMPGTVNRLGVDGRARQPTHVSC